jgi:hypothetical protein
MISEEQLIRWSGQGATSTAADTNASIRRALESVTSPQLKRRVAAEQVEVYLQGSYRNDTNIRGDSDVDVVIQLNEPFEYNIEGLDVAAKARFRMNYPGSTMYTLGQFRADVLAALQAYYGRSSVTDRNKAIRVEGASGRLPADVVACVEYRRYTRFDAFGTESYIPGISFYTQRERRQVINYPRPHYQNGVAKNTATGGHFKPLVRVFKNARNYLVDQGVITEDLAPSYFVQCLLYNASNSAYSRSTLQDQLGEVVKELFLNIVGSYYHNFVCQNGQVLLFGTTPEQWSPGKANKFLSAMLQLWSKGT